MATPMNRGLIKKQEHVVFKAVGQLHYKQLLLTYFVVAVSVGSILSYSLVCSLRRLYHLQASARSQRKPVVQHPSWVAGYLNYTTARCNLLLKDDKSEQKTVRNLVSQYKKELSCYRDRELAQTSCRRLQIVSSSYSPSQKELDFPLAFSLRVHTCATQLELLLRSIYAPQNFYCIHADAKASTIFLTAVRRMAECFPNVQLARLDFDFVYASASQMNADLECMRVARTSQIQWRYFINLAGQELPLKTNLEMVETYTNLNGSSNFRIYQNPSSKAWRHETSIWCKDVAANRTVKCAAVNRYAKQPPPGNVTIFKSCSNGAFSRAFVEYMLDDPFSRRLHDWFNDTWGPEEHYFATLLSLPSAPGGVQSFASERAVLWRSQQTDHKCSGRFVRAVCIFVSADLPYVVQRPELFANKFNYEDDPFAIRCLVKSVLERRRNQSAFFRKALVGKRSNILDILKWPRP